MHRFGELGDRELIATRVEHAADPDAFGRMEVLVARKVEHILAAQFAARGYRPDKVPELYPEQAEVGRCAGVVSKELVGA